MKKVLWFSRHLMQVAQAQALMDKLGDVDITQVSKSIQSAQDIAQEIEAHDIIAVVAPPNLLAGVLRIAGEKACNYRENGENYSPRWLCGNAV